MTKQQSEIKKALNSVVVWVTALEEDLAKNKDTSVSFSALREAKEKFNKVIGFKAID